MHPGPRGWDRLRYPSSLTSASSVPRPARTPVAALTGGHAPVLALHKHTAWPPVGFGRGGASQRCGELLITARRAAVMSGQMIFGLGIGFAPEWALCCTSLLPCTGGRSGPAVRVLEPVGFHASGAAAFLRSWKLGERVESMPAGCSS
jgi:hypothetical protein